MNDPDSEIGMGSARGPRAGLGDPPKPSSHTGRRISTRESLWDKVFGGPPKTARQRRALPPAEWDFGLMKEWRSVRLRFTSARQDSSALPKGGNKNKLICGEETTMGKSSLPPSGNPFGSHSQSGKTFQDFRVSCDETTL
jgi:hypothetical protein